MAVISNSAIAADLAVAGKKAKYDSYIKNILSNKSILAWILKFTTDEFRDFDIVEIVECIENPEIGSAAVNPGYGSYEKVIGLKNEDKVPNEGENEEKDGGAILLNVLSTIVNDKIQVSEKLRILKEGYSIETTKGIREEVAVM